MFYFTKGGFLTTAFTDWLRIEIKISVPSLVKALST